MTTPFSIEKNAKTGKVTQIDLTPDEIAAADARSTQETADRRAAAVLPALQFMSGALMDDWITVAEFEAWASKTALPAFVLQIIDADPALDAKGRAIAKARALNAAQFERASPLVIAAAQAKVGDGWEETLDQAFEAWAAL